MTQCPSCSQSIAVGEEHFGTLYRCEHCQAEFFIGFDGKPENSKEPIVSDNLSSVSKMAANIIQPMETLDNEINSNELFPNQPEQGSGDIYNIESSDSVATPEISEQDIFAQKSTGAFNDFTQDVRDFGNDSVTAGILSFDIEISGIDLGEIKRDLIEALDDKRFGWNLPELTQNIKEGKLIIKNISAPKVIVLVKRITPIGLSLNWRHHVSTQ